MWIKKNVLSFIDSPWDDLNPSKNAFIRRQYSKLSFLNNFNFNNLSFIILVILLCFISWLASGFYKIQEGEKAIVLRFGKYNRIAVPGLNYRLPRPIEYIYIEKVDKSRRVEIGYRSTGKARLGGAISERDVKNESLMLTGDENIIELNVDTMWHIKDLAKYVFNVMYPIETVKVVAESAIREVIGKTPISSVLSNQKQLIAQKIEILIQQILDQYNFGIEIEKVKLLRAEPPQAVIAAYRDVQTAKADKEKIINESESYKNDILPRARGQAAKIIEDSEAYRAETVAKARGNVYRFNAFYIQYIAHKELTKNRLYLETIENILSNTNKVILDTKSVFTHMPIFHSNSEFDKDRILVK